MLSRPALSTSNQNHDLPVNNGDSAIESARFGESAIVNLLAIWRQTDKPRRMLRYIFHQTLS